jgi:tRNA(fMet)-specific endonuclease VapC
MALAYLLDTNIISDLVRNPRVHAARRVAAMPEETLATSIIVASELRFGCAKKGSAQLLKQVEAVLSGLEILLLDIPTDAAYGSLRATLERSGQPIGSNDLFIAAHALNYGLTLVTDNEREFCKIGGLKIENWLR